MVVLTLASISLHYFLDDDHFLNFTVYPPSIIENLELYRILTGIVLHTDHQHLAINLYCLSIMHVWSPVPWTRMLAMIAMQSTLYLVWCWFDRDLYDTHVAGLSSVIYAEMMYRMVRIKPCLGLCLIVTQYLIDSGSTRVSSQGHLTGMIAGAVMAI